MESTPSVGETGSLEPGSRSSVGERLLHTQDVASSILAATTIPHRRFVYIIQSQTLRLVKVGLANDPRRRLRGLQTGSPDKLELLGAFISSKAPDLEIGLQRKFAEHRAHGEWYHPKGEPGLIADRFRVWAITPEYGFPVIDMDEDD